MDPEWQAEQELCDLEIRERWSPSMMRAMMLDYLRDRGMVEGFFFYAEERSVTNHGERV